MIFSPHSSFNLLLKRDINDDRDKIMGIAQGGDDYVEKPFHLDLLKAEIYSSVFQISSINSSRLTICVLFSISIFIIFLSDFVKLIS